MGTVELFGERWAEGLVAAAEADRELRAIAAETQVAFLLASESRSVLVDVRGPRVTACVDPDLNRSWDFSVRAPVAAWERLFSAHPRPPAQHVLGLWAREPSLHVDGSRLALMQHLRVVQRLLELAREVTAGPMPQDAPVEPGSGVEPITGRYVWVTFQGRRYRIYFEEAAPALRCCCSTPRGPTRGSTPGCSTPPSCSRGGAWSRSTCPGTAGRSHLTGGGRRSTASRPTSTPG
jgi:hypothetical protein